MGFSSKVQICTLEPLRLHFEIYQNHSLPILLCKFTKFISENKEYGRCNARKIRQKMLSLQYEKEDNILLIKDKGKYHR